MKADLADIRANGRWRLSGRSHEVAAPIEAVDQSLALEHSQGALHRCAADLEDLGDRPLQQHKSGRQGLGPNMPAQHVMHDGVEALAAAPRNLLKHGSARQAKRSSPAGRPNRRLLYALCLALFLLFPWIAQNCKNHKGV